MIFKGYYVGDDGSNSAEVTSQSGRCWRAGQGPPDLGTHRGPGPRRIGSETACRARPRVNGARHAVETAPTCVESTQRTAVSRC